MSSPATAIENPGRPRLLMADDHLIILDALGAMMKNDFEIFAVDSCNAFLNAVDVFKPDVAILDVNMPGGDGFSTARKVLEDHPELPIVFLSMYFDRSYAEQAARIGAKAYLSKRVQSDELISALKAVLDGKTLLEDQSFVSVDGAGQPGRADLTARQREVLRLIALGCSAKDVANELNISVRTAEFHRAAIMQRLGLHSTAQMTRYAITNNIA
jgi:DNA-binding NarL/FixJ family response regulator